MPKNMKRNTITDYRIEFLKKSVLKRSTDLNNQDSVLYSCCVLAYADMLTAGKYFLYEEGKEDKALRSSIISKFLSLLKDNNYCFSRKIINDLLPMFGKEEHIEKYKTTKTKAGEKQYLDFATRFGLSQKFVNMCFKYFFVFEDNLPDISFDFHNCDCPLDSVILSTLNDIKTPVWSKMEESIYVSLQSNISKKLSNVNLPSQLSRVGRLAYDFLNW